MIDLASGSIIVRSNNRSKTIDWTAMSAVEEKDRSETQSKEAERPSEKDIGEAFLACSRCSYFLSGYRLIHNNYQEVLESSTMKWLELRGGHRTRLLIQDSYGSHITLDTEYFEGICPDCQRRFVYESDDAGGPHLRIRIKPG